MALNTGKLKQISFTILAAFLFLILFGCNSKTAKFTPFIQPEKLYLKEQPYSRIYVEVDTVEGVEVHDQWLDMLKEFLSTHCSKSKGIEIVRDKPVPFDDIKDMPIGPASILCLDGPNPNSSPQPAYLHVFFYAKDKIFKKTREEPHVTFPCSTAIFYNVDYGYQLDKSIKFTLTHETGHVLGLCKNESHGDGSHCTNRGCLMRESTGYLESLLLLFGTPLKSELCDDCMSDLENYKSENIDPNLIFDGPFLVRKEDGYYVASLPYYNFIIPQSLSEKFEWQLLLKILKNDLKEQNYYQYWNNNVLYTLTGILRPKNEDASPLNVNLFKECLTKATLDPDPVIRKSAAKELEKLRQKHQE